MDFVLGHQILGWKKHQVVFKLKTEAFLGERGQLNPGGKFLGMPCRSSKMPISLDSDSYRGSYFQ